MRFAPSARLAVVNVAVPPARTLTAPNCVPEPHGDPPPPSGMTTERVFHRHGDRSWVCAGVLTMPDSVAPKQKFTVPSVPPVGVGVTVAVNVTVCPINAGFGKAVSVVVVLPGVVIVTVTEVE